MSQRFLIIVSMMIATAFSFIGCISSEETGAGDRARSPVQVFGPIDTTQRKVSEDNLRKAKMESSGKLASRQRVAPKFKSKQDTVRASVVTKSKSPLSPRVKIVRPKHPIYTVQIGAFSRASNALRSQKKAKERFGHQPVFNNFVKSINMYRVSVGRYKDRSDAFSLSDTLKQNYPYEYEQCWINFIP